MNNRTTIKKASLFILIFLLTLLAIVLIRQALHTKQSPQTSINSTNQTPSSEKKSVNKRDPNQTYYSIQAKLPACDLESKMNTFIGTEIENFYNGGKLEPCNSCKDKPISCSTYIVPVKIENGDETEIYKALLKKGANEKEAPQKSNEKTKKFSVTKEIYEENITFELIFDLEQQKIRVNIK
jgi:hypothetical protein